MIKSHLIDWILVLGTFSSPICSTPLESPSKTRYFVVSFLLFHPCSVSSMYFFFFIPLKQKWHSFLNSDFLYYSNPFQFESWRVIYYLLRPLFNTKGASPRWLRTVAPGGARFPQRGKRPVPRRGELWVPGHRSISTGRRSPGPSRAYRTFRYCYDLDLRSSDILSHRE